jgi:hypothetical protein
MNQNPDMFVIHSRADAAQYALYRRVQRWCQDVGLSLVDYHDWEWETTDAVPDFFGNMPTDPWHYMPNHGTPNYMKRCRVVLIVETTANSDPPFGVIVEVDERTALFGNPAAVIVCASKDNRMSARLREKLGAGVSEFVHLDGPDDLRILPVLAVAWLVSSLERSGPAGRKLLDAAVAQSPYIHRFLFFGPFWTTEMLSRAKTQNISEWWPTVATVDEFMRTRAEGQQLDAWSALLSNSKSRVVFLPPQTNA